MITTAGATATWLIHGPRGTAVYPGIIFLLLLVLLERQRARVNGHPDDGVDAKRV